MQAGLITIVFTYELKSGLLSIQLTADVEQLTNGGYLIKNFRKDNASDDIIPPLTLQKLDGIWVHGDSKKETQLSDVVGKAIDLYTLPSHSL